MIKRKQLRKGKIKDIHMTLSRVKQEGDQIELEDIFKCSDHDQRRKIILLEGAPGCGKSTVSVYICQQWGLNELFNDLFKFVFLIKLCKPSVQSAKNISDLLPGRDPFMSQKAADKICARYGEGVLFILDGWDELPSELMKGSIFQKLIYPELSQELSLHKSAVIVTSRPISSGDVQEVVSSRIEVLGFTEEALREYFTEFLKPDITATVDTLMERLKEAPAVAGSCYLPLNASIVLHIFECHRGDTFTATQYDLLNELIFNCINRNQKKTLKDDASSLGNVNSLLNLPEGVKEPFQFLCELAYDGFKNNSTVFTKISKIPPDLNTLGLLHGVESFTEHGKMLFYYFFHQSIQEILTACHIAMCEDQQASMFNEIFNKHHFNSVLQYYAAITKLQSSRVKSTLTRVAKKCGVQNPSIEAKILLISLLHCLYEAQQPSLCERIARDLQQGIKVDEIRLSPLDCLCIGYFLSACKSKKLEIDLSSCSIDDDGCEHLVSDLCKCEDNKSTKFEINLTDNDIQDQGISALSKLLKKGCIKLNVSYNRLLTDQMMVYIANQLNDNCSLVSMNLSACNLTSVGAQKLSDALRDNGVVQELNISLNALQDDGVQYLANAVRFNKRLKSLRLVSCGMTDEGLVSLADALEVNYSLECLHIWNDPVDCCNSITDNGLSNLANALESNSTLMNLWLPNDFKLSRMTSVQEAINQTRGKGVPLIEIQGIHNNKLHDCFTHDKNNYTILIIQLQVLETLWLKLMSG